MKKILFLPFLALIFASFACSSLENTMAATFESGRINFVVDPNTNNKYHNDETDPPTVSVLLYNGFNTEKTATVAIQHVSYLCVLKPKTQSPCAGIKLSKPGVYEISASVAKLNGGQVTSKTSVEWMPYTYLDKLAQSIAGGEGKNPAIGYGAGIAVLVVIVSILLALLGAQSTNNSWQGFGIGAIAGFFISMILLAVAVYQFASPGLAALVITYITGITIFAILALVAVNFTNNGAYIKTPQGGTYLGGGKFIPQGHQLPGGSQPALPYNPTRQITASREQILLALLEEQRENNPDLYDQYGNSTRR